MGTRIPELALPMPRWINPQPPRTDVRYNLESISTARMDDKGKHLNGKRYRKDKRNA